MIKKEAEIFGLLFLGGGATISRRPLLNIMASDKNIPVAALVNLVVVGILRNPADDIVS